MNNKPTSLLAYLLKLNNNKNKTEGNTTQIVYDKEKWKKFKHILDFQGTTPSKLFWNVLEIILNEYDQKEHSLDKFIPHENKLVFDINKPIDDNILWLQTIDSDDILYDIERKCRIIRTLALAKRNGASIESLHQGNLQYFEQKYGHA